MRSSTMKSVNYLRLLGGFYLMVIILAGFSQGYVRGAIISPGDAGQTASNILDQIDLYRLGLSTDLLAFILDAVISVMLYQVFKPFNKNLALISAALRLLAHPAIASLNLLNHYLSYQVLQDSSLGAVFNEAQLESLSLMFTEAHRYGYLIAGAFFGLHLFLLGIQIYRSKVVPELFGGFLLGSALGYLMESFGNFNVPGHEGSLALIVGVSAAIGEVGLTFYLLISGASKSYKEQLKQA